MSYLTLVQHRTFLIWLAGKTSLAHIPPISFLSGNINFLKLQKMHLY